MTRINIVPVEILTDKHLLAEYKEITRPFNKVISRIEKGTMNEVKIPLEYCLGIGHETFFFDKLKWLFTRYMDLFEELVRRGVNIDEDKFNSICRDLRVKLINSVYWNDYYPFPEEIYLNMARLCRRSNVESVTNELNSES